MLFIGIRQQLIPDDSISSVPDIYDYIEQTLFPLIFNQYYSQEMNKTFFGPYNQGFVTPGTRILNGIRFKQSLVLWVFFIRCSNQYFHIGFNRVDSFSVFENFFFSQMGHDRTDRNQKEKCIVKPNKFSNCYDDSYSDGNDFIGNGFWRDNPYLYKTGNELQDDRWYGRFGSYESGGYIQDFVILDGYNHSLSLLQTLKNGNWLDTGTKAFFIDFIAFNPSTMLHSVARIAFEIPIGGNAFLLIEIKSWKFNRYSNSYSNSNAGKQVYDQYSLIILHVLCLVFIAIYSIDIIYIIVKQDFVFRYFGMELASLWYYLEILHTLLFWILIGVAIKNEYYVAHNINLIPKIEAEFESFRILQSWILIESYIQALCGFLLYIKLFKYSSLVNDKFNFFSLLVAESIYTLIPFFLIIVIVFYAFGFCGFLMFGSDLSDFRNIIHSFGTMFEYIISSVDYIAITESSRIFGSIYYYIFSMSIFLVLINVFIEIISVAYVKVVDKISNGEEHYGTEKGAQNSQTVGFFGLFARKTVSKISNVIKGFASVIRHSDVDIDGDGQITDSEIADKYGITIHAAREHITKFDCDGDGKLNVNEFEAVLNFKAPTEL